YRACLSALYGGKRKTRKRGLQCCGEDIRRSSRRQRRRSMKQAHLVAPKQIELHDIPTPQPGPGEVLVKIRAALTCGTDLKTYRRGHPKLPFGPFGHEASGDVVAVGAGVTSGQPGA